MITICPQCQLPLAVTVADLRVAQGQVRCGRCAAVFNALASLYDPGAADTSASAAGADATRIAYDDDHGSDDDPQAGAAPDAAAAADPAAGATEPSTDTFARGAATPEDAAVTAGGAAAAPGEALTGVRLPQRDWAVDTMTAAELAALVARADHDEPDELASIQVAAEEDSDITVLPADEPADAPNVERARAAASQPQPPPPASRSGPAPRWLALQPAQPAPGSLAASLGLEAEADFGARTITGLPPGPGGNDAAPRAEALDADAALGIDALGAARPVVPAARGLWAATLLLGVALVAQLGHLYREELVAIPALYQPLTSLYAALGRPVAPRWDLGGYEVRQQGVVAEPVAKGTLTVRASIRNGAVRAQPAPLLRVMLQDRFGNRIAIRDLTPREYGGAAALAPAPMLAPGQRIDAEVSLLDPGGEAVGFELDVCLRRSDSSVSCAGDAPAVQG